MTGPAYPLVNGSGCSRGSPVWTTPATGTPVARALAWPSCASCYVARTGRSPCRTALPGPASPPWCASPPDRPRDRLLGELVGEQLADLGRVECRALAQVVTTDEQVDGVGEVQGLADTSDEGRVGPHDIGWGRPFAFGRVVQDHHGRGLDQCLTRGIGSQRSLEDSVNRKRVGRDDRYPHAGRRDLELRDAQDLAGLVADLELLRAPAALLEGSCPRDDIHRQRCGEGRVLTELVAHCSAHVAGVLTQLAIAGEHFHLVIQTVNA